MSNLWVNLRIGTRHLQIGAWFITFRVNRYNVENPPKTFVEFM